jgi:hypothetical protein
VPPRKVRHRRGGPAFGSTLSVARPFEDLDLEDLDLEELDLEILTAKRDGGGKTTGSRTYDGNAVFLSGITGWAWH